MKQRIYIAYGSNMSEVQVAQRCPDATLAGTGLVNGYELLFKGSLTGCYATIYQVLSAKTGSKHGLNVSGLVFDEIHAQPNRKLYDVLTKGSGDAREQPLFFIITTAGNDKNSICYELHTKTLDLMAGRKKEAIFFPWSMTWNMRKTGRLKRIGTRRTRPWVIPYRLAASGKPIGMPSKIRRKRTCSSSSGSIFGLRPASAGYRNRSMTR